MEERKTSFVQTPDLSLVCGECRDGFGRLSPISQEALQVFQMGAEGSLVHGASSPPSREALFELGKLLDVAVNDFLGGEPKSYPFCNPFLMRRLFEVGYLHREEAVFMTGSPVICIKRQVCVGCSCVCC